MFEAYTFEYLMKRALSESQQRCRRGKGISSMERRHRKGCFQYKGHNAPTVTEEAETEQQ